MHSVIITKDSKIDTIFDIFDTDQSGRISFDEFYLLMVILIANRDQDMRHFLIKNIRTVYNLLDCNGNGTVDIKQIQYLSFLLDIDKDVIVKRFYQFDTSHNDALNFEEFELFALATLEKKKRINKDVEANEVTKTEISNQNSYMCNLI